MPEMIIAVGILLFVVLAFGWAIGYGQCANNKSVEINKLKEKIHKLEESLYK
jgi:hypothetical protein